MSDDPILLINQALRLVRSPHDHTDEIIRILDRAKSAIAEGEDHNHEKPSRAEIAMYGCDG